METTKLLLSLTRRSAELRSQKHGKLVHQKVIVFGLQNNIALCKNLISLYFSCHLYESAKLVFNSIENPLDISLWNGLISAYIKNLMFVEALQLFERLLHYPYLKPDNYTYPSVIKACSWLGRADYGRMIHTRVMKSGIVCSDVVVSSSIVDMYAKCGMLRYALQLFDEMPVRDVACWNTVISCYHHGGQYGKALNLFEKMKHNGYEPDSVTFTTAISSCSKLLDLRRGKEIHGEAVTKGFSSDGFVEAALVDMYGKCSCLEMAIEVFEKIPRKSLVSFNSMIVGYSLKGDSKSCIELLLRMNAEGAKPTSTTLSSLLMACSKSANLRHGKFVHGYIIKNDIKTDIFIHSSLVDLYFKCGSVASAEFVFAKMSKSNAVEWNVMISGYVLTGSYLEALGIYSDMNKAGIKPDAITFTSVLAACSQLAALEQGKDIHKSIIVSKFESNEIVMGALLDMYAKCGAMNEALEIFNQLPERDLVSWTSMITAYGSHGQASEALKLFQKMMGSNVKPDRVAFLAVISACSHAGLIKEGCYYFNAMINQYGIKPKIADYSCLVDLLGRAGKLHDAYAVLRRTPAIRDDVGLLSTLFSACHLHGDLELGEEIAGMLIDRDPDDPSTYIILANMYASIKKWDESRKVRLKMKELRLKKNPGCTWIEVDKKIKPFLVEDKKIPQADMVYECLSILSDHMKKDELFNQIREVNI